MEALSIHSLIDFQFLRENGATSSFKYLLPAFLDGRVKKSDEIYQQLQDHFSDIMKEKNIVRYSADDLPPLDPKRTKRLKAMKDSEIDFSDIPEIDDWENAKIVSPNKKQITIRLDADILEHFKTQGKGYQSRINSVLKAYVRKKRRQR